MLSDLGSPFTDVDEGFMIGDVLVVPNADCPAVDDTVCLVVQGSVNLIVFYVVLK